MPEGIISGELSSGFPIVSGVSAPFRCRSDHLPVGVSGQVNIIQSAIVTMIINGTIYVTLHALCSVRPRATRELKTAGIAKLQIN
jgi:hypothetical protein